MKQVLWGLAFLWISSAALAHYPNRPVGVVVPFPAGSSTDIVTRVLANSVSQSIGQQLVVDNKAGADGAIAAAEVARSAPDGYTLLMATNSPMSAVPALKKSPPYDPVADFTPITDVGRYAGRVQMMLATPTTGLAHVKDGKLRAFATTLSRRSPLLPEVPTIAEAGMPEFSITSWAALFGPARMPREILERLNKEFAGAMGRPEVQASMEKQAFALNPSSPEQLADFVKEQLESYRRILRAAGVQPE